MPCNELEESTCCIYRGLVDGCEERETVKQGNHLVFTEIGPKKRKYLVSSNSLGGNALLMPETRSDILSACQIVAYPGDTYK